LASRYVVAGNWKLHGSLVENQARLAALLACDLTSNVDVIVLPPFTYLAQMQQQLDGVSLEYGAQDVSRYPGGAYTGDVSAQMLADLGCRYALVGHSERRQYYGESDDDVAAKFIQLTEQGIVPIVCVGETLAEREAGQSWAVIERQLGALGTALATQPAFMLAYEPVWAIGTGQNASPEQAQAIHGQIRAWLKNNTRQAEAIPLLYGGSVKPDNAEALFKQPDVDGGLIGGASLDVDAFVKIIKAAEHTC